MAPNRYYSSSAQPTTLAASLSPVSPGLTGQAVEVWSVTGMPVQYPFTLLLEWGTGSQEVVTVTQAATGTGPYTFANCTRGDDGTTAPAHALGAAVVHGVSARDFTDAQTALAAALASLPAPSGTASAGMVPLATGSGEASAWGFNGAGATTVVPKPTGLTATDTPNVTAAIANFTSALSFGPATLLFQDGTYQVDSNALVIRNLSNFAVRSAGRTVIAQAPNRSGLPNNTAGDLFIIADCTDVTVEGITFDGMRDTVAPITALTASASSGQPSVTVASGQGARYVTGQYLCIMGGLGSTEQNQSDGFKVGAGGIGLLISSITPGGGAGGGDLITFSTNLAHSYTQVSSTLVSDGFGPYACNGAYLTPYQAAPASTVAGRSLSGEDQQNGLHLLSCQRVTVTRCTSRNTWESPVKLGTGFASTSLTDGCSQVTVTDCTCYHGYDQGVSIWVSDHVTVKGCTLNACGWAGTSMTASDYCTVTGNQVLNSVYQVPGGLGEGSGIVTEGGVRNMITGNVVTGVNEDGMRVDASPLTWGLPGSAPTLGAFTEAGTAAGTPVQLSSTTGLIAGGMYSLLDDARTEGVKVASVVDGTHVTLADAVLYSHASGTPLSVRIAQENVITANTVKGPGGNGITCLQGVRTLVKGNVISRWSSSGNGIVMDSASLAGGFSGGFGTLVEGNDIGGGGGACIRATGIGSLMIRGNRLGAQSQASNSHGMRLTGIYDSEVSGNDVTDMPNGNGISMTAGGPSAIPCTRVRLSGNKVTRTSGAGIVAALGQSLVITGNVVTSCGSHGGIDLQGVQYSVIEANACNSNNGAGIELEDSGSTFCLYNRVTGNTCRDDGSGVNVTSGATWTQARGIFETGSSNFNLFTGNECDSNATAQLVVSGAGSDSFANIISGAVAGAPGTINYGGLFGDGSDGSATLDGTATVSWASKASSTYTMTRDCYMTSLTVNNGVTLVNPGGKFMIFCTAAGTVTNNGTITAAGGNASGATAGTASGSGTLNGNGAGGAGQTGNGSAGASVAQGALIGVGASGAGGAGGTGTAGASAGVNSNNANNWLHRPAVIAAGLAGVSANPKVLCGAPGGGGGGGDGSNAAWRRGAGGGFLAILAGAVVNNGTITVAGGNGANGVAGNAGGGGGGGGGCIWAGTLTAWTAGTVSVAGGTQGSGVGTGSNGNAGTSGNVVNVIVQ